MGKATLKILLVDDDTLVRDMMAMILESEGHDLETADHGAEAWEKYCATPTVGLIISDMHMPVMNGLELIKAVRKLNKTLPLILLTGNEEPPPDLEGEAIDFFLTKDENIQETILRAIDTISMRRSE